MCRQADEKNVLCRDHGMSRSLCVGGHSATCDSVVGTGRRCTNEPVTGRQILYGLPDRESKRNEYHLDKSELLVWSSWGDYLGEKGERGKGKERLFSRGLSLEDSSGPDLYFLYIPRCHIPGFSR